MATTEPKTRLAWRLTRRKVSDLIEYSGNPRRLTKKGLADLRASLDRFGVAEPIVIQPDGTIIGGHARKAVCVARGDTEVDCMVPDRELTPEEVRELNVRLNRNIAGEWDWDRLANEYELEELKEWGFDDRDLGGSPILDKDELCDSRVAVVLTFVPREWQKVLDALRIAGSLPVEPQELWFAESVLSDPLYRMLEECAEREGLRYMGNVFARLIEFWGQAGMPANGLNEENGAAE